MSSKLKARYREYCVIVYREATVAKSRSRDPGRICDCGVEGVEAARPERASSSDNSRHCLLFCARF